MAKDLVWDQIMLAEFRKLSCLTEDEDKVLSGWACNRSIAYIAINCGMSERTVSRNLESLREKYDAVRIYSPLLPARNK